jgi:hypothetical protein
MKMKRSLLPGVLALLSTGAGCDATTIKVPAESEITVPGANILGGNPLVASDVFPSSALSDALAQSIAQSFDTSGYDKDAVDSITLSAMSMTVTEPEENGRTVRGLGFIDKLTISAGADGVDPVVVAESADGAFDGNPGPATYDMPLTNAELNPVFQAGDSLDMTAELAPAEPPNFDTVVKFSTELTIKINVGGVLNGG